MSYHFIPPSAEEQESVTKLQEMIKADSSIKNEFSPVKILRFLRGRKGRIDRAIRAIAKHDLWRIENNIDSIKDIPVSEECKKKIIFGPKYKTKDGMPAIYIIVRYHDKNKSDINEIRTYIISAFEEALSFSNPAEERMTIVFDMSEFSYSCMDYEAVRVIIDILSFNYPETLGRAFIINSPVIFSACWFVISPWIEEVTRSKIVFESPVNVAASIDLDSIPIEVNGVPRK